MAGLVRAAASFLARRNVRAPVLAHGSIDTVDDDAPYSGRASRRRPYFRTSGTSSRTPAGMTTQAARFIQIPARAIVPMGTRPEP